MAIAATAAAASPAQSTAAIGGTALSSLSSNFSGFLRLLMTQLQNQDPTSPMDTNEFTRELVQFSSVEQQIATNTSLTRLIELTQAGEVMQSSAMIGRRIAVQSEEMPLQNGQGTLRFSVDAEQPVRVAVLNGQGATIAEKTFTARRGANEWVWDGKDATGRVMQDGSYRVSVHGVDTTGTPKALPYQVVGTASGVTTETAGVRLQLGSLTVPFSAVRSVTQ
jgi:flagellar basal-body rod modification protein FlgD